MSVPRCKKSKKFMPKDDEKRKIVKANQLAAAISLYYLGAEYGWKDDGKLNEYFDAYCENLDYCHALSNSYRASGGSWNAGMLLKKLGYPRGVNKAIYIKDDYVYEASQLVFAVALKTAKDMGFDAENERGENMLALFEEAYLALYYEAMSTKVKFTAPEMFDWCKEITDVDVREVITWQ